METIDVVILAYNQGQSIITAIKSVLAQVVDCGVNVLVGDDCSTDNTQEALNQFDGTVKVIKHSHNMGASKNLEILLSHCKGEYVAILEGDDYWVVTDKLQQQVDFLRENKEFGSCGCDVQGGGNPAWIRKKRALEMKDYNGLDMCYQTSSILFKNPIDTNYDFLSRLHRNISDRTLQGFLLTLGKAYRLNLRGIKYCNTNRNGLTQSIYCDKPACYLTDLEMLNELYLLLRGNFGIAHLKRFKTTTQMLFGKTYIYLMWYRNKQKTVEIIKKMISKTGRSGAYWALRAPMCIMLAVLRIVLRRGR